MNELIDKKSNWDFIPIGLGIICSIALSGVALYSILDSVPSLTLLSLLGYIVAYLVLVGGLIIFFFCFKELIWRIWK